MLKRVLSDTWLNLITINKGEPDEIIWPTTRSPSNKLLQSSSWLHQMNTYKLAQYWSLLFENKHHQWLTFLIFLTDHYSIYRSPAETSKLVLFKLQTRALQSIYLNLCSPVVSRVWWNTGSAFMFGKRVSWANVSHSSDEFEERECCSLV